MSTVSVNPRLEGLGISRQSGSAGRVEPFRGSAACACLTNACPSYGKPASEADDPVALLSEIRANCADDDNYIRQSLPLQEIVFRTLLLADDQTLTLRELHYETDRTLVFPNPSHHGYRLRSGPHTGQRRILRVCNWRPCRNPRW